MKKFFIGLFAAITFVPAFTYLVSCLTPYISPVRFWPMAFLALGFPYLAVVLLFLALSWLFIRKRVALFLLMLFFAGFQNLFATFALDPSPKSNFSKDPGSLRILTWNVRGFDNSSEAIDTAHSVRKHIFDYISEVNPDVICFQEFAEHFIRGTFSNTAELRRLGYRYFYRTDEMPRHYPYGTVLSGTAIFSRLPIIDSHKTMLGDTSCPEYLACIDVLLQNKPIRIFATHFKSINLFANPVDTVNKVIFHGDDKFVYEAGKLKKIRVFAQEHAREAAIAKKAIDKSPYPVVVGTDMNSVPASYPYHTMSYGLQDAFKLKGWGLGTTLENLPKTLRIDFLLADKKLSIQKFREDDLHLSDHFPQFMDVSWKH